MNQTYTKSEWKQLKATAAMRWRLYSLNPFLPADVKERETAKWLAYEEAADNALDLLKQGHTDADASQMTLDFLEWKLGGEA